MTIDTVFIDLDNTLLDFYAIEDHILGKALRMNGITPTPEVIARYQDINVAQWLLLEQGELELEEVGVRRFELLVNEVNPAVDAKVLSDTYDQLMEDACFLVPGAEALLQELRSQYRLCLVTNGVGEVQHTRIHKCGLEDYFDAIFVSSDLGCVKPSVDFFEACFATLGGVDAARSVMIGDGINADVRGGIQMGMRTIWFNPWGHENNTEWHPDAEIVSLKDVPALLEVWENEDR